ncbi:hypothetical protein Acr_19g0004900 [Actinidia rufa]|uniref:UDP-N-acetylglucosamine 1-carboxyvinyltransferase n=1 Tax=Actinidia rufa TaxID=165716 RepID=A0A7J0G9U8_9ERIC|nr:hypothetical protein Acr_19g0004900 [Actinidia rufa]
MTQHQHAYMKNFSAQGVGKYGHGLQMAKGWWGEGSGLITHTLEHAWNVPAPTSLLSREGRSPSLYGSEYAIIPDRIEAGTFMLAAAITRSCISMSPVVPYHLSCLIDKLVTVGCKITRRDPDILEVYAVPAKIEDVLQGFDVKTSPFPGFPTDLQPQTTALLTTCDGLRVVEESVFENRMSYASVLRGSQVVASDLRGGVLLVLAGLSAEGNTEIDGVAHIDRGYENLEMKLQLLGADVKRLIPAASKP